MPKSRGNLFEMKSRPEGANDSVSVIQKEPAADSVGPESISESRDDVCYSRDFLSQDHIRDGGSSDHV